MRKSDLPPYGSDKDVKQFMTEAFMCLHKVIIGGEQPESPEGMCHVKSEFFRAFMNTFLAMYDAHRGKRPEVLCMVRLEDTPMHVECMVDRHSAYYNSPDPESLPNTLRRFVGRLGGMLAKINRESEERNHWGGLKEPGHHMKTRQGGRC